MVCARRAGSSDNTRIRASLSRLFQPTNRRPGVLSCFGPFILYTHGGVITVASVTMTSMSTILKNIDVSMHTAKKETCKERHRERSRVCPAQLWWICGPFCSCMGAAYRAMIAVDAGKQNLLHPTLGFRQVKST